MEKIDIISSCGVFLGLDNVDTDQIIPARFLKATSREGFGDALFADWRSDSEFCINRSSGTVIVVGANFGCGSSREHAAWALYDYGFRAVVGLSFADIFRSNALNNGLLTVAVSQSFIDAIKEAPDRPITINLEQQSIKIEDKIEKFEIDRYKKKCLLNGFDDIDYLVNIRPEIERYEAENHIIRG